MILLDDGILSEEAYPLILILGGLGLQRLEAGFRLPASDWGQVTAVSAPNPSHQTSVSDRALTLRLCRKRIPTKMESSETSKIFIRKKRSTGLPWWRSGWESACQCRGHGFEPWSGKTPHAAEQLGPWATTTEPACLEPVLRNKRGRDSERPAHRDDEWPPLAATRESPRTETKTQHSQK